METTDSAGVSPVHEGPSPDVQLWFVAANIVTLRPSGPGEPEPRSGTKHFKPGAKVYVIDWVPGASESLVVIGRHRKSHQFLTAAISVASVEPLCLEQISTPSVTALARKHADNGGTLPTKEQAEALLHAIQMRLAELLSPV